MPTSWSEQHELAEWAKSQPDKHPAIAVDSFARHIEFMAATLPTRNIDEESGRKRVAVYLRILGGYSEAAIAHLSLTACRTLQWFPTPAQCLEILRDYRDPPTKGEQALALCHHFAAGQFNDWIERLQGPNGDAAVKEDVPDRWRRIARERLILNSRGEVRRPRTESIAA